MIVCSLEIPNEFDPNNHCQVCSRAFKTTGNYRPHLQNVHKMHLAPSKPSPNAVDVTPALIDEQNNCSSCKLSLTSKEYLCFHLQIVHRMVISEMPDINDPNFCCHSCKVKYKDRSRYRDHLRNVHRMKLTPLRKIAIFKPATSADGIQHPDKTSCETCKRKYSRRDHYRGHMEKYHKDDKSTPITGRNKIEG